MTSNPVVSVIELAGQYKSEFENGFSKLVKHAATFANSTSKGLLTGFIFSDKDLIGIPPIAALTPISIGLIPHFGSSIIGKDHAKLLCLTIGGGFILHLSLGTIIDLSLPYLLLAGLYGFIGFAILQLYVNNAGKDIVSLKFFKFIVKLNLFTEY
ncbi:unnamed protein product [Brugia timori]|uniref:Sulfate_transp domain-containing protein n=1 Tax=Brugia timori TaxID=42155 RepID=A0A0R3RAV8_9BILA|nr:unnamed protein product [Brugia timori]